MVRPILLYVSMIPGNSTTYSSSVKWGPEAVLIMGAMPSTRGAALVATTENISIFTGTCNTG